MSAVISITVELDDKAWESERHAFGEASAEEILADAIDYMSGWRILPESFGEVTYSGSLSTDEEPVQNMETVRPETVKEETSYPTAMRRNHGH